MALEGTFKDFGLADIFQLIGLQKKTGVLTVRGEGGRLVTISFEKGAVVFADELRRGEEERLGSVLLRNGLLSREQLDRAVAIQADGAQRLGHILVEQRFISHEALAQALQLQVRETVYRLFRWQVGSYHFSAEPVAFDQGVYAPIPAEFILMEGSRMIDEWPVLERRIPGFQAVLERVPAAAPARPGARGPSRADIEDLMAIVDDGGEGPGQAAFERGDEALGPREDAILALVDGARTVQEIIDLGRLGEFETCKVLYGLLSLNLVRVRRVAAPSTAGEKAETAAAPRRAGLRPREYAILAAALLLAFLAFLFNPWGIVAQGFRAREGRRESAALLDAVRLRRVRLALEAFFLEKQAYPSSLEKLVESGLLRPAELRGAGGARFDYQGGGREYRLDAGGPR